ncbi:MAG TPA: zf-HC2 domain-containing protein, partial [Planctomycetota bacterium]|nr:zf-HC2 domain-containing protein [Planctomycetota bacterium]
MDCEKLREVLIEHVDGLLGREEAEFARAHLAECSPCRALQEEVRRNFAALDAWEDEDLPSGAFERLRARIPSGPSAVGTAAAPAPARRWLRLLRPYAAGLATAAAGMLAAVRLGAD